MEVEQPGNRRLVDLDAVGRHLFSEQPGLEHVDGATRRLERLERMVGQEEPGQQTADDQT